MAWFWRRRTREPQRQPEGGVPEVKPPEVSLGPLELTDEDLKRIQAERKSWQTGTPLKSKEVQVPPSLLGYDQAVLRTMGVSIVDGDDPWSNYPYKPIESPESARVAPVGKVGGSRGIFYVPVQRGALTRVSLETQVGEPVEATYIPGEEELRIHRTGLAGKFGEASVDDVICIVDRQPRLGENKPVILPKDTVIIPVRGDMVRVDPRRPGFEDASMPAALAKEVAPSDGEDPEFVARVKGLVEEAGIGITVHGKTPDEAEKPKFNARFVKRNMGYGVYTDVLTLTPFDAEDAEAVLAVHANSSENNTTLRVDMTEGGVTFNKSRRHGEIESEMYFAGVSVQMPFSRKKAGEFTVPVGDDTQESRISYKVTGRDTGQVNITQPDGTTYEIEVLSSRREEVKVTCVEAGGVYLELGTDAELVGFLKETLDARRGMHDEMSRTEGLTRIFSPLFTDVARTAREPAPAAPLDAPVGEPLNPAKHWNEMTYGRHPDEAVRSLLPEQLRLPPPYPSDVAVDNQPLGYRAVYPPEEWYKPKKTRDHFDDLSAPYPQGFEIYQRMGLLAASPRYVEDVLSGNRRGILLTPMNREYYGLDTHVVATPEGKIKFSGMMSGPEPTHWVRTNLIRGSCNCYVSDGRGKVTDFHFYAMETPIDDLKIEQVSVHPRGRAQSNIRYVKTDETYQGSPVYAVAEGQETGITEGPPADKSILLQTSTIPGLTEPDSITGVREVVREFYKPFGPGNVLIGRGSGFGLGMGHNLNRNRMIEDAKTGTVYTPGPQQEDAFRRNLGLDFLDRD